MMASEWELIVPAHAKINLALYVLGKRPDGYHDIWTILQEVTLHDTLYFRRDSAPLRLTTDQPALAVGADNLVRRAARLLHERTGCPENVAIHLKKRIPVGAGLGGGSSDAAAALSGLNRLFQLGLSQAELAALGAELGSDVAFFLYGGAALATGRGEQIQPLAALPARWILLVNPGIHVSSGWAYKNLNLKLTNFAALRNVLPKSDTPVMTGDQRFPAQNMLEEPVIRTYPVIRSIKGQLLERGAEWAMMSGSGSTVFGIFRSKAAAEQARQQIARPDWLVVVTHAITREQREKQQSPRFLPA